MILVFRAPPKNVRVQGDEKGLRVRASSAKGEWAPERRFLPLTSYPAALARLSIDAVRLLRSFAGQYSWKKRFPAPEASAASSMDEAAAEESV